MPKTKTSKTSAKASKPKPTAKKTPVKPKAPSVSKKAGKAAAKAKPTPKRPAKSAKKPAPAKKAAATSRTKAPAKPAKKPAPAKKTPTVKKAPPVKKVAATGKARVSTKELAKKVDKTIEPHALNDNDTEKVRELIHLSREQGYLTYKDIDDSLPDIANQPEELQNIISIFNNLEIKLLDSKEVEKFKKKKEDAEEETARTNQSDMLDDPVRMYLKQMGQVPLLTREEEVDISKRIEAAESSALKIIYSVSLTADFQLEICRKLLAREERFDRVVL
ncbi:MAG: sigma-70 factor domain-containing protein, partial [Verrucomicrobiota bacterium]|nr:sigma-70 factor domain-containing protein [Verrucomicrobiota bacterium]